MNRWHIAAHRSELANPGDFILLPWTADGELAVANMGGQVVAFDNRCPHRGARIFTELRGNREPRCQYHARLATAENVKRFETAVIGDFILVGKPPAPHCAPEAIFDLLQQAPWLSLHCTLSFVMDCHWTVAVENALDAEHVDHVHAGSLAKLALRRKALHSYPNGSSLEQFTSGARLDVTSKFFPHEQPFDYVHAHLFPYSCLSSTRGWTYSLQHYFPRPDGRTNFIHRLYTAPTDLPMPGFFDSVAKLNARVFAEDAAICALVAPGHTGTLGPNEERIRHFRSHL
jgi:phenylpropionate dioxygenase-like ring-hydroxylating dioxygenase large terminal subunit